MVTNRKTGPRLSKANVARGRGASPSKQNKTDAILCGKFLVVLMLRFSEKKLVFLEERNKVLNNIKAYMSRTDQWRCGVSSWRHCTFCWV
jgi:hypothetical protein